VIGSNLVIRGKKWMEKTRLGENNLAVREKMSTFAN
jgi:hypothetical protein